jgi:hypothetical protein
MAIDVFDLTADFAEKVLGTQPPGRPTRLTPGRKEWFLNALREETQELEDAETLEDEIDATIDLIYFAAGRLREMGVQGGEHFMEVHWANMEKGLGRLAKRSGGLSAEDGIDAVKPEGWVGPDHAAILAGCPASRRAPKPPFPRVLILGHARHGKDTVAEMLRDRYGLRFSSSSMFCAERVMMPYFAQHGVPYATVEECYEDRGNHRSTWFDRIEDYNSHDRARLAREMLEAGNDMYVGMRSDREFQEAQWLFDFVVWVDSSGRGVPPEAETSMTIRFSPGMLCIRNDGTLEDLQAAVDRLAKNHLGLETSK